jgi:transposase InsO family protein
MNPTSDPSHRDRWARLRFSIIGHLLAAPPEPGTLHQALAELAGRGWRHPTTGRPVRFGVSTLERWYYAARRHADPVAVLRNRPRTDAGRSRVLSPAAIAAIARQYHAHPSWTVQLHYDNLQVVLNGDLPSYATVRRHMKQQGLVRRSRPPRATDGALAARTHLEQVEVRSFEVDYVNALWHLDFHHGSRKLPGRDGGWLTPILLGVLDDRSRLVCHAQWYLGETVESLVHGFCQALQKRGLPRALMSDNGAAMLAGEFTAGLAHLGILHQTTLPYSPYQNAKQEVFWARVEGRLMAMLDGERELTLNLLNEATQAWVEGEYHRTVHHEIGGTPLARFLGDPQVGRACPGSETLRQAFRIEVVRTQRRSDGTVSVEGTRFEVPSRYRTLPRLHLRYARWDLARVDLVDARTGASLCPLYPLDKSKNANGERRRLADGELTITDPPAGMAPLLRQLIDEQTASGLPPAYLPKESP